MALCDIYDTRQNLCGLWGKSGRKRMLYQDKTCVTAAERLEACIACVHL
jgi:hypothetical protein